MPTSSTKPCPSLSAALKAARDDESGPKITRETVGDALLVSDSTAGRVMEGEYDDRLEQLNHSLRSPLGVIFAQVATCGTPYTFVRHGASRSMDFDGDGRVDKDDVMAGAIEAMKSIGEQLAVIQQHGAGKTYTVQQGAAIQQQITEARAWLDDLASTVNAMTVNAGPRAAAG
jgi:hypothetical protein